MASACYSSYTIKGFNVTEVALDVLLKRDELVFNNGIG